MNSTTAADLCMSPALDFVEYLSLRLPHRQHAIFSNRNPLVRIFIYQSAVILNHAGT